MEAPVPGFVSVASAIYGHSAFLSLLTMTDVSLILNKYPVRKGMGLFC